MKCPKCKKNLQTKRTTVDKQIVRRERFCHACKIIYTTVEYFDTYINKKISSLGDLIRTLETEKGSIKSQFDNLKKSICVMINMSSKG